MKFPSKFRGKAAFPVGILATTALLSTLWAVVFIHRSSFPGPDGRRYFSLFDDAMISMRYAWNLAHGHGLAWNPGDRVEGYTNFLMTLVMAVPQLVLSQRLSVLAIQILGVLFCLGAAWVMVRRLTPALAEVPATRPFPFPAAVGGGILCLTYYPFWYWSLLGMETGLLTLLVTVAFAVTFAAGRKKSPRASLPLAALYSAIVLTRPDASLFVAVLLGYLALAPGGKRPARYRAALTTAAMTAVPILLHLLFRVSYYGQWVPNTYFLKVDGIPWDVRFQSGVAFLAPFFAQGAVAFVLLLGACAARLTPERAAVAAAWIAAVGHQIYVGGDAWPYWRILTPVMPAVFAVVGHELSHLAGYFSRGTRQPSALCRDVTATAIAVAVTLHAGRYDEWRLATLPGAAGNERFTYLGLVLDGALEDGATMGLFRAGAALFYAPNKRGVDFLGKSDRHVASAVPKGIRHGGMLTVPGHNKTDLSYSIVQLKPDFIEHFSWLDDNVKDRIRRDYVRAEIHGLPVLLRKDSPRVRWERVVQKGDL